MDEVTEKLTKIFEIVNDWLKFAEAKNAVLLGFSGAGIAAALTYLSAASNIPKSIYIGLLITIFFLCLCSFFCSLSFLPKTNLEYIVWKKSKPNVNSQMRISDNDNLYYFGHLLKYQPIELMDAMNRLYFEGKISNFKKKEYLDLSTQIILNSEIAYLKFKIFSFSLYLLIISIISVPLCLILSIIIVRKI